MLVKFAMLFQLATNVDSPTAPLRRIGGWSEGAYDEETTAELIRSNVESLCAKRAAMLPKGGSIIGQRYQIVGNTGPAQTVGKVFPGRATAVADIPQMAVQLTCVGTGVINKRKWVAAGIPDDQVKQGEYTPDSVYRTVMGKFIAELEGFKFKARDHSIARKAILTVAAGVFTFTDDHGYVIGDDIEITGVMVADQRVAKFRSKVATVPTGKTLTTTIAWPYGNGTDGSAQKVAAFYPTIAPKGVSIDYARTRKIGRPSTGYRGRRSKRR